MMKMRLAAIFAALLIVVGAVGCGSSGETTITRSGTGVVVPTSGE